MTINLAATARLVPLTTLILGSCVSQNTYDQVQTQNQQLQVQLAQSRAEQKFVESGDMGPALQRQGVPDNLVLSTRRASTVVTFLVSQGVNPTIISAKGFGETHPEASNDTPQGRAANRTVQGPGAPAA
jgi:OmpA family